MSSVGPSDGGYQYYQKNLDELEDELQAEAKKSRKNQQEQTDELEKRYVRNIRDHDDELADTLKQYKGNADETISRERARSNAEIERVKQNTYDKWGRYQRQEADAAKRQLDESNSAADQQHAQDQRALHDADDAYHARLSGYNDENAAQTEKAVEEARDSAAATYDEAAQESKNQFNAYREESEKKTQDLDHRRMDELNELRRRYANATDSMKRDYDRTIDRLESSNRARFNAHEHSRMHDDVAQTRALNQSHAEETANLRQQMRDVQDSQGDYQRGRAQGTQDAVQDYEDDWRHQLQSQQDTYDAELDNLKQKQDEQEHYYTHQNAQNLKDKDRYYTGIIKKQNLDSHLEQTRAQNAYLADRKATELGMKQERETATRTLDHKLTEANRNEQTALENQAHDYQDTMSRQDTAHRDETAQLQRELQFRRTATNDTNAISPALEENIRKSVMREYEKSMAGDAHRNRATIDGIQQSYSNRLHDSVLEHETKERQMDQAATGEQHRQQVDFLDHIRENEDSTKMALRGKDADNQRVTDHLTRNYALSLNRQKAESDDILNSTRNDASNRIQSQRQDAEFASRMEHRAFANQQNELIRDYDKKLADQKFDFDTKYDDLKIKQQTALRDTERKQKQQLDEMQKAYEQRQAQTEAQHKERERYLTQSYEAELEKVRRSNALLIEKKS